MGPNGLEEKLGDDHPLNSTLRGYLSENCNLLLQNSYFLFWFETLTNRRLFGVRVSVAFTVRVRFKIRFKVWFSVWFRVWLGFGSGLGSR